MIKTNRTARIFKIVLLAIILDLGMTAYKTPGGDPVIAANLDPIVPANLDPIVPANLDPIIPANLQVPAGNKLSIHVFAKGVQIYKCTQDAADTNRFSWVFVAPDAGLYTKADFSTQEGRHYAGPTWESNDGSKVTAIKLQQANAPDPGAIPWLLLRAASCTGSGVFGRITFIQRLYTSGGKAPTITADRAHKEQEVRVAYTAEYFFYQAADTK